MNHSDPAVDVLIFSSDIQPVSGWGSMTFHFTNALARRDWRPRVILPRGAQRLMPYADERFSLPPWKPSFGRNALAGFPYAAAGRSLPPGIRHVMVEFPYAITAAAGRRGGPVIVSGQGTYLVAPLRHRVDRRWYLPALRRADVVTVPSAFSRDQLQGLSSGLGDIRVIPNPIDLEWLGRAIDVDPRSTIGLPPGTRYVLSVGALKARKGMDVLLRAFAQVNADDIALVIVGPGDADALRSLAHDLGVSGRVKFAGLVPDEVLRSLYRDCEFFAMLPRRVGDHFEGFGLVYLEAGAFEKAVVATASGGVTDAVLNGRTGLVVAEDDVEGAACAFNRLLADEELSAQLGAEGRRWAEQHTWDRYAMEFDALYRELLDCREGT